MKKRAHMVDESDPGWLRFWASYPRRVAKKDARKAWAEIAPSLELVEKMCAALEWQVPAFKWAAENEAFAPYPASWLRAERWEDERRATAREPSYRQWTCPHVDECSHQTMCRVKLDVGEKKYPLKAKAEAS